MQNSLVVFAAVLVASSVGCAASEAEEVLVPGGASLADGALVDVNEQLSPTGAPIPIGTTKPTTVPIVCEKVVRYKHKYTRGTWTPWPQKWEATYQRAYTDTIAVPGNTLDKVKDLGDGVFSCKSVAASKALSKFMADEEQNRAKQCKNFIYEANKATLYIGDKNDAVTVSCTCQRESDLKKPNKKREDCKVWDECVSCPRDDWSESY